MTTETAAPPSKPAKTIFQGLVKIHTIEVRDQVRKKFDKNAHEELVSSVKAKGIISPITVRPNDRAGVGKNEVRPYILVAGERRLRAALGAGLEEVPVIVRDLDDQAAALYQVEENIHRKDLTPIEEARGYKLLTQPVGTSAPKYTVEALAQLVDKSTTHVYRALALLELPKVAVDAIELGTLTPAHGHQLMRVPPFDREELLKEVTHGGYDGRIMPANELRDHINQQLGSDLAAAKFPKDKPFAGMSACSTCPSNTGNQAALFDGAEKGTCTNGSCFATKTKQQKADFLEKTKVAHLDAAFVEYGKGYVCAGTMRTGGYVVKDELTAKNAKGTYGVIIDFDQKLWLAIHQAEKAGAPSRQTYDWEKDNFVRGKVQDAIYKAEAIEVLKVKASRKVYEAVALDLLNRHGAAYFAEALGVKKIKVPDLTDDQIAAALVICSRGTGWHPKKKEIEAVAKKQALKDYADKKAAAEKKGA